MDEQNINKTIVITYDDATRMVDFCKDEQKQVSKEFFDWYLKPGGEFFTKVGMLLLDFTGDGKNMVPMAFNFSNPDEAEFTLYLYRTQKPICRFIFHRQDNLTMEKVSIDITYFSAYMYHQQEFIWANPDIIAESRSWMKDLIDSERKSRKAGVRAKSRQELIKKAEDSLMKEANLVTSRAFVYYIYALMYYTSKQEPEEITTAFQKKVEEDTGGVKVKSIYKYTGYIDLRESKVYKPLIKKDPDDPVREYKRHIEKWSVKGHYHRYGDKVVWVEEFTKGKGELEKRVYSTEDEKDLNLIPKLFEVERTVKVSPEVKAPAPKPAVPEPLPIAEEDKPVIKARKKGFMHILFKLLKLFKSK